MEFEDLYVHRLEKCIISLNKENTELRKKQELLEAQTASMHEKCLEKVSKTKRDLRTALKIIDFGKKNYYESKREYEEKIETYEHELIRVNSLLVCNELKKTSLDYESKLTCTRSNHNQSEKHRLRLNTGAKRLETSENSGSVDNESKVFHTESTHQQKSVTQGVCEQQYKRISNDGSSIHGGMEPICSEINGEEDTTQDGSGISQKGKFAGKISYVNSSDFELHQSTTANVEEGVLNNSHCFGNDRDFTNTKVSKGGKRMLDSGRLCENNIKFTSSEYKRQQSATTPDAGRRTGITENGIGASDDCSWFTRFSIPSKQKEVIYPKADLSALDTIDESGVEHHIPTDYDNFKSDFTRSRNQQYRGTKSDSRNLSGGGLNYLSCSVYENPKTDLKELDTIDGSDNQALINDRNSKSKSHSPMFKRKKHCGRKAFSGHLSRDDFNSSSFTIYVNDDEIADGDRSEADSEYGFDENIVTKAVEDAKTKLMKQEDINGKKENGDAGDAQPDVKPSTFDEEYLEECLVEMKALMDFNDIAYMLDAKSKRYSLLTSQSSGCYVAPRVKLPSIGCLIKRRALSKEQKHIVMEGQQESESSTKNDNTKVGAQGNNNNTELGAQKAMQLEDEIYEQLISETVMNR